MEVLPYLSGAFESSMAALVPLLAGFAVVALILDVVIGAWNRP